MGSKTESLGRELDEVKGSCQRLPKMEDIERSLRRIIVEEIKGDNKGLKVRPEDSILNDDGGVDKEKTSEILFQAVEKKTAGGFGLGGLFGSKK